MRHGRAWERQGWVSFFEDGKLTYTASAGVRVHGGGSRLTSPKQGFRLFFRRAYGAKELPAGIAFQGAHAHPVRRLILHNDVRDWRTGHSLALPEPACLRHRRGRRRHRRRDAAGAIFPQRRVPGRLRAHGALRFRGVLQNALGPFRPPERRGVRRPLAPDQSPWSAANAHGGAARRSGQPHPVVHRDCVLRDRRRLSRSRSVSRSDA